MNDAGRLDIIRDLQERVRQFERSRRVASAQVFATGSVLDQLLPEKGLAAGTLIEWLSEGEGSGAGTLALALAAGLLRNGGALVVLDGKREFYPPAAVGLDIPLDRTIVLQPDKAADALWAMEQALRCCAVTVALAWFDALNDRGFRRLQLAAEAGGSLGFLLRPIARRAEPSWAEMRFLVEASPAPSLASARRLRVEVLHCRGGAAGGAVELELNHEADPLRLARALAHPALPPCAAGA